jgi:hypothetical protein
MLPKIRLSEDAEHRLFCDDFNNAGRAPDPALARLPPTCCLESKIRIGPQNPPFQVVHIIFAVDLFRRKPFSRSCPPLQGVFPDRLHTVAQRDRQQGGRFNRSVGGPARRSATPATAAILSSSHMLRVCPGVWPLVGLQSERVNQALLDFGPMPPVEPCHIVLSGGDEDESSAQTKHCRDGPTVPAAPNQAPQAPCQAVPLHRA